MIPKELHQIWFDFHTGRGPEMPRKYRRMAQRWRDAHPDFGYTLWDERRALDLIETHYNWFLPTYLSMAEPVCRVDAARYAIMHHVGGVYLDTDVKQKGTLYGFLDAGTAIVFRAPLLNTLLVNNVPLLSERGHPFWLHVLKNVTRAAPLFAHRRGSPFSILSLAGPNLLTVSTLTYRPRAPGEALTVLDGKHFSPYPWHRDAAVGRHMSEMTWRVGPDYLNDLAPLVLTAGAAWLVALGARGGQTSPTSG